jgi:hypothetical protein
MGALKENSMVIVCLKAKKDQKKGRAMPVLFSFTLNLILKVRAQS